MSMKAIGALLAGSVILGQTWSGQALADPGTSDDTGKDRDKAASEPAGSPGGETRGPARTSGEFADSDISIDATDVASEGVSLADRERARDIFLAGNALARRALNATAASKYHEAVAIWPHPVIYYNLSIVQMRLAQKPDAYESLQKALRLGGAGLEQGRYEEARQRLAQLDGEFAHVTIVCNEPNAEVRLDGRVLFTGPGRHEGVLPPGNYTIEARKPGYLPTMRSKVFSAGEPATESLVLRYEATERRMPRWIPWAVTGLGVALVAAGGVSHWQASEKFADYDAAILTGCDPDTGCLPGDDTVMGLADVRSKAVQWRTWAAVSYVAGSVLVVSGLASFYFNRQRRVVRESRPQETAMQLTPLLAREALGMSALLRF